MEIDLQRCKRSIEVSFLGDAIARFPPLIANISKRSLGTTRLGFEMIQGHGPSSDP